MTPTEARAHWDGGLPLTILPRFHPWRRWLRVCGRHADIDATVRDLARVGSAEATAIEVPIYNAEGEMVAVRSVELAGPQVAQDPTPTPGLVMADPMGLALLRGELAGSRRDGLGRDWSGWMTLVLGPRMVLAHGLGTALHGTSAVIGVTHPDAWTPDLAVQVPQGTSVRVIGGRRPHLADVARDTLGAWRIAA
jgi:hypothetical protein